MTRSPAVTLPAPVTVRGTRSRARPLARPSAGPGAPPVIGLILTETIPGFPGHREYVLVAASGGGLLYWLQSAAPDGPRFLVVPPAAYFPHYVPALPSSVCTELGLDDAQQAQFFCVVTVPDGDVAAATANLRAPVVVHATRRLARQVVLSDTGYPIRLPLRR